MKYFKYNIISNKNYDVNQIGQELRSNRGNNFVPEREAQEDELYTTSKRVSQFLLTKEEAETLQADPRIQEVELDICQRDDIEIVNVATQVGDFRRDGLSGQNFGNRNWGLKRNSSRDVDLWQTNGLLNENEDNSFNYSLAGDGVDIVVIDSGFVDHPDFHDERGISRLQKINWYEEYVKYNPDFDSDFSDIMANYHKPENYYVEDVSNHGTSCASIAAGKLHGLAKKSHIYGMRHNTGGILAKPNFSTNQHLSMLKDWHLNKGNNRPTVLSLSYSVRQTANFDNVSGGGFRDSLDDEIVTWNRGTRTNAQLANEYNIRFLGTHLSATVSSTDALLEELIDVGVHVVCAAGNENLRQVTEDHPEYNNYINITGQAHYYNRKASPYAAGAIQAGALDKDNDVTTGKEDIIYYSNKGQGVDLYAAGDNCIAASSNFEGTNFPYEDGSSYYSWAFGGTSCAAPQTAGLMATYLSANPKMTPQALKEKIIADTTQNIILERSPTDYTDLYSFLDSNNRVLYNRYNQANSVTYNTQTIHNIAVSKKPLFATSLNPFTYISSQHGVFYQQQNINGVNTLVQKGSFDDDDTGNIYPSSKIVECKTYQRLGNSYNFVITFSGDAVTNANWEKVEYNARSDYLGGYANIVAYRKDAIYNDATKKFTWILYDIKNIRTYTHTDSYTQTRNTLQFF